jgi:hypothetical protein
MGARLNAQLLAKRQNLPMDAPTGVGCAMVHQTQKNRKALLNSNKKKFFIFQTNCL